MITSEYGKLNKSRFFKWQNVPRLKLKNEQSYTLPSLEQAMAGNTDLSNEILQSMNVNKDIRGPFEDLFKKYSHFKSVYPTLVSDNQEAANFLNKLTESQVIAILADNVKFFTAERVERFTPEERCYLLAIASAAGSGNICKLLIERYQVKPNIIATTTAFLSRNLPLAKYYIEERNTPPKLAQALNYTAKISDVSAMQYLVRMYEDDAVMANALKDGASNLLATAAYNKSDGAAEYIDAALKEGAKPNTLSFDVAFEESNIPAFELFTLNRPQLFEKRYDEYLVRSADSVGIPRNVIEQLGYKINTGGELKADGIVREEGGGVSLLKP